MIDYLVQPLVKLLVFVVILLEFLGPDCRLEVFEFVEETVEDEFPQFLGDKHYQALGDERDMVIHSSGS